MEFNEVILNRHSVRHYIDEPVDRAIIDEIIAIAQTAPSSKNCRSSAFMIVDDPDTLLAISQMRDHGSRFVSGAKAAIVVLGHSSESDMWIENAAISSTFIQLAATSKGLGSCWVQVRGRNRSADGTIPGTAEQYLRDLLGIVEGMSVLCVVALGYEAVKE